MAGDHMAMKAGFAAVSVYSAHGVLVIHRMIDVVWFGE